MDSKTGSVSDIATTQILNVKPQGSKRHIPVQWKRTFITLEMVNLLKQNICKIDIWNQ